jgi:2-dehydropantoate 2-reductase
MKICIYGIGAVGGLIGARVAAEGSAEVTAIARGATLAALSGGGLRLQSGERLTQTRIRATEHPAELGVQDVVVVSVKGPALPAVAAGIAPLLGADTVVLSAMNGVPWWFFDGVAGPCAGMHLESVDPGGVVTAAIPARRVIGCVVHLNASAPEPGLVVHRTGNGLILGEPDGSASARVQQLAQLLARAGFDVTTSARIQNDIWYKLWGNLTFNPISALTGATGDRMLADPLVLAFCTAAMEEAARIGDRIGCAIKETPQQRHTVTRKLGAFRTSMLQDAEAGRPLEIDAIVGAAKEIGERVGVATPTIDALLGLIRLLGRTRGLYPEAARGNWT